MQNFLYFIKVCYSKSKGKMTKKSQPVGVEIISSRASSYENHRFDPYYEEVVLLFLTTTSTVILYSSYILDHVTTQ